MNRSDQDGSTNWLSQYVSSLFHAIGALIMAIGILTIVVDVLRWAGLI